MITHLREDLAASARLLHTSRRMLRQLSTFAEKPRGSPEYADDGLASARRLAVAIGPRFVFAEQVHHFGTGDRFSCVEVFASSHKDGEEWETNGRKFKRVNGRTMRVGSAAHIAKQKQIRQAREKERAADPGGYEPSFAREMIGELPSFIGDTVGEIRDAIFGQPEYSDPGREQYHANQRAKREAAAKARAATAVPKTPTSDLRNKVRDAVARSFPGAKTTSGDSLAMTYLVPGTGRQVMLQPRPDGTVEVAFFNSDNSGRGAMEIGKGLQRGSLSFARGLKSLAAELGKHGIGIHYEATSRRDAAYGRFLRTSGFKQAKADGEEHVWKSTATNLSECVKLVEKMARSA